METVPVILDEDVELALIKEVPHAFAKANMCMPLRRENGRLLAAVADEKGVLALRELARHFSLSAMPLHSPAGVVIDAINRFYGQVGSAEDIMDNITGEDLSAVATEFEKPRDILELTEEAPIIRLLNAILQQAVKERASDIHI